MCPMVRRPPGMEIALLGFLRQGPQHGYQIHQILSDPDGLGTIWHLKQSQLYALLAKLEKDGYLIGELEAQIVAHPPRRVFHLSTAGLAVFLDWLKRPVEVPRLMRQEFMAKYYFALREGKEHARVLAEAQFAACQGWLGIMKSQKGELSTFSGSIHRYRIGQIEAMLAWLGTL